MCTAVNRQPFPSTMSSSRSVRPPASSVKPNMGAPVADWIAGAAGQWSGCVCVIKIRLMVSPRSA